MYTCILNKASVRQLERDGFVVLRGALRGAELEASEGGMIRLETLIQLKYLNSSFSSLILLLKLGKQLPVEQFEATVVI